MTPLIILLPAALLLPLLLHYEKKGNRKAALTAKTVLSLLFVVAAAQSPSFPGYSGYLLGGLILCLFGDVFLAKGERFFKAGLAAFLLGHVFYVLGFAALAGVGRWFSGGALFFLFCSAWIFLRLRPHLHRMLGPVLIYILVITVMVSASWAVFREAGLAAPGRWMILLGAASFYVSDVFVARNKFVKNEFLNRLAGLPLYYLGQFLLAFSPGLLG